MDDQPRPVAFLGLGRMGLPMSRNLARAGFAVRAWNRNRRDVREPDLDYRIEASAGAAIAPADVVVTMLPDLPEVIDVCDGLLRRGQVVVVMGTVSPVAVRGWAADLSDAGVDVVDAPVSGGDVGARDGALSIMVGASDQAFARVRAVLDAMGSVVRHLGPVGCGQLAKACNQIVVAATLTALGEAVVLGTRGGLDPHALLDVLAGGLAGSRALDVKREALASHVFTPGGLARFQHKDLGFALAAARDAGVALPLTAVVDQLFGALRWTGHGDDDHSGVLQIIEALSRPT
ncbi:MAG TPA: NAD(P)-dependent oxidoreductase [Euzebyales bacterium]|nr:NAD(P)-dependent oxidoreductase [Euzebyales bacterium]